MASKATNTLTEEELLAPLASMEDLSVFNTPMTTPGASPRTRARWSHRSSTGSQYEPFVPSPLVSNSKKPNTTTDAAIANHEPVIILPAPPSSSSSRKNSNSLYKQTLENGSSVNKYVTPYKHHDLTLVMNADLPPSSSATTSVVQGPPQQAPHPPVRYRVSHMEVPNVQQRSHHHHQNQMRLHPRIDEMDELRDENNEDESQYYWGCPSTPLAGTQGHRFPSTPSPAPAGSYKNHVESAAPDVADAGHNNYKTTNNVQFLTPRLHHHHQSCAYNNNGSLKSYIDKKYAVSADKDYHEVPDEDRIKLMPKPRDRYNFIYLILVLHGIGTLLPWNMFITAKEYFVDYKLGEDYTNTSVQYSAHFMQYIGFAAQIPNLFFNWMNIFLNIGGNITGRIVWTLFVNILVFVFTIVLAMVDSSEWPGIFFYLTVGSVVILNMSNGIYQSTVFGIAAKMPFSHTGAVVLGTNLSGSIVSIIGIISLATTPNARTAAIYYFITALFILLACFDSYFALPLNKFFRYHEHIYNKNLRHKKRQTVLAIPYLLVFKQCFPQCLNIFFTYFTTLVIFPAVLSDVKMIQNDFIYPDRQFEKYFTHVVCFLTFNISAVLGNLSTLAFKFPSRRWILIPVILRLLFIPFFLLCNYQPDGIIYERNWPILIIWDSAFWAGSALFGFTGGYLSSLSMMHCPRTVDKEYASVAGMFGAASIVTGSFAGLGFSYLMPIFVSHYWFAFVAPDWWPKQENLV